jgi:hypothetical protein
MVPKQTAKKRNLHFALMVLTVIVCYSRINAQTTTLRLYNSWNVNKIYTDTGVTHTAWKPILYEDTTTPSSNRSWLYRKFFQEHLLNVQQPDFTIYADIIVDEYIGYDKRPIKASNGSGDNYHVPMMNTRGYEVSGSIGKSFYFETNFYENQGRFGAYVDSFIRRYGVIPRQARYKNTGDGLGFDFNYSNARLIYTPNKHWLFDLGYNRNFVGDGYRSMLLSDYATDHPYFKAALTFGNFQYSAMWSQYVAEATYDFNYYAYGYPHKWAQTYLLDWKATKHFTASLFESVIWPGVDSLHHNDLGITYASPIMFLHSGQSKSGLGLNELVGLNLKYQILPKTYLYGQAAVDQLGKNINNRYAAQLGIRAADFFKVPDWNALLEFNTARPYTYSTDSGQTNYSHAYLPLAHPLGANFKELLGVTDYTYKNWWFRLEGFVAKYGNDTAGINFGHNILNTSIDYPTGDIKTGQGAATKLYYGDLRVAYIFNKKNNLRIEGNLTYRHENGLGKIYNDLIATIGVRMTFRNLYYDF